MRRGIQTLLDSLPRGKSQVRATVYALLFRQMPPELIAELFPSVNLPTVLRYRRLKSVEEFWKRAERTKKRRLNLKQKERQRVALEWIKHEVGRTLSGRTVDVFTTHLTETALYQKYRAVYRNEAVSQTTFSKLASQLRVHYKIGAYDTFSCEKCRDDKWQIEHWNKLAVELHAKGDEKGAAAAIDNANDYVAHLEHHFSMIRRLNHQYRSDLAQLDAETVFVVVDWTTYELSSRSSVPALVAVVLKKRDGMISRQYFDFLRPGVAGRKADFFSTAMQIIFQRVVADGDPAIRRIRAYADSGASDFRNNSCVWQLGLLKLAHPEVRWEFSFFAPYHGWSDADRHAGAVSRMTAAWYRNSATTNPGLVLTEASLPHLIMSKLENTTVVRFKPDNVVPHYEVELSVVYFKNYFLFEALSGVSENGEVSVAMSAYPSDQLCYVGKIRASIRAKRARNRATSPKTTSLAKASKPRATTGTEKRPAAPKKKVKSGAKKKTT
jgi:hypothetical protein